MSYNPDIHHRKSIRLKNYDYSKVGLYFITICTQNKEKIFGEITNVGAHCMCPNRESNTKMILSEYGKIVEEEINKTNKIRENIEINEYVIMPNHVHFIIEIIDNIKGHMQCAPTIEKFGKSTKDSIPTIVKLLKSSITKRVNILRNTEGYPVWQRNYYENIIRNEKIHLKVSDYINNNPIKWVEDRYYK